MLKESTAPRAKLMPARSSLAKPSSALWRARASLAPPPRRHARMELSRPGPRPEGTRPGAVDPCPLLPPRSARKTAPSTAQCAHLCAPEIAHHGASRLMLLKGSVVRGLLSAMRDLGSSLACMPHPPETATTTRGLHATYDSLGALGSASPEMIDGPLAARPAKGVHGRIAGQGRHLWEDGRARRGYRRWRIPFAASVTCC